MKKIFIFLLLIAAANGFAQKVSKPEVYAKTITAADLKKHLYIVASPEMEGRETGTQGERKAAAYLENQFRNLGLEPGNNGSYHQYFNVYYDSLIEASVEVNGRAYQLDQDFIVPLSNIAATMRFSEFVLVGAGSVDSLRNANLNGKLVMLMGATQAISTMLLNKGAAAIITVGAGFPRRVPTVRKGNKTMSGFRRNIVPQQFTVSENLGRAILGSGYDSIRNSAAPLKTYSAEIILDVKKTTITLQSSNVIAVVPGTDLKDEYLFITAHYDHLGKRGDSIIYYGADDDGSGTVGVIEIAEAFAKAKAEGKGARRSVVFMAVSGEEKGLWGSDYYSSYPVFPLVKTTANLNIDMIGRSDSSRKVGDSLNYVYVVGDDKLSTELRSISEAMNKKYLKMELDYKFNDPNDRHRIYFRSDHYNFAKVGVPIIFYYDGMLGADYHRPTDTPDKINYNLLAKRAQLIFYTAWEMANRSQMVKRDLPLQTPPRGF